MKKLMRFALVLVMSSFVLSSTNAAGIPDEQWSLVTDMSNSGQELRGIAIQDDTSANTDPSKLVAIMDNNNTPKSQHICSTLKDDWCAGALSWFYTAVLQPCDAKITNNCISALTAIDSSGKEIAGTYVRGVPQVGWTDFPGDDALKLPTGGSASLWNIPGVQNGGGTDQYVVNIRLHGGTNNATDAFSIGGILSSISPVSILSSGKYGRMHAHDGKNADPNCAALGLPCGIAVDGEAAATITTCAAVEDGACAIKETFPSGVKFKLSVKLSSSPTGWFHGRMKAPEVSLNAVGSGVELAITAEPVVVPAVGILVPYSQLSTSLQTRYKNTQPSEGDSGWTWGNPGPNGMRNSVLYPLPSSPSAFEQFQLWNDYFKDKATASPTVWNFSTLNTTGETAQCFRDSTKFVGMVTTNSMMYSAGPPVFNKDSGTLDYKVGSPHFTSKGEVFKGTYDLQIRSDVARCLYNFTSAPVKATISISNESGSENVATTVVNEKDNWLSLSAYNFTFSTPTVKIKLNQEVPVVVPAPVETKAPEITPVVVMPTKAPVIKKVTITCVKGKTTKKVTAVKPICPKGYSKK